MTEEKLAETAGNPAFFMFLLNFNDFHNIRYELIAVF